MNEVTTSSGTGTAALVCFGFYLVGVFVLAWLANRALAGRKFVSEYFLGSRSLGVWAFALTFAATSASGGSFIGFPALVYSHGWVVALWISSYMLVPLLCIVFLGKRLNQVARRAGAVTLPEVMRERFNSLAVGMTATSLLLVFMFFYLAAQFKAGSNILITLLGDLEIFQAAVAGIAGLTDGLPLLGSVDPDYLLCLVGFAAAVIVYTTYGGFRAVVWTDVMQGVIMALGVVIMLVLALGQVGGLEQANRRLAKMTPPEEGLAVLHRAADADTSTPLVIPKASWVTATHPETGATLVLRTAGLATIPAGQKESEPVEILRLTVDEQITDLLPRAQAQPFRARLQILRPYAHGADQAGVYLTGPGPHPTESAGFLGLGMALSFFAFWVFGGTGQPSNMVRLMAFNNSRTLKRSILLVAVYYSMIYFPIVLIFCCARLLLPGMEVDPDRIMPEMAAHLTAGAGVPWLAGLLVAAPFAAVMSSVDSFLLMVSSALVRDIYQREINPQAEEAKIKKLSYLVTALVGLAAVVAVMNPPKYLQNLIIFATSGLASCFLMPVAFALYSPKMTARAAVAGMIGGGLTHAVQYIAGYLISGKFTVYDFLGLQPFIWNLVGSTLCILFMNQIAPPPDPALVRKFFGKPDPVEKGREPTT